MQYSFLYIGEYITVYGYSCYKTGTEFYDLHDAYTTCSGNLQCFGISDGLCDMVGKFTLCMKGIKRSNIDKDTGNPRNTTCIYRKEQHHGNKIMLV